MLHIQKGAILLKSLHKLHPIYHKDKTGVVYSKRCNIANIFAYVYSKGAISPTSLHNIATSDISQGQNWCFVFKKVQYRLCLCICVFKTVQYRPSRCILLHLIYHKDALCLCILLHPIYHKNKTGVVYSKRCSIVLRLYILLHLIYHTDILLVLCIQKGAISS